jgi:TPR repeat protein
MKMSFKAIAVVVLASSFTVSATAGPLEDAQAAERRDDCTTAVSIYGSLAEKGVVEAYNRLGYFSQIGYCGKRDWLQAAKWYGKASDAGDQTSIASLSFIGRNWRVMYRDAPTDPIIYELIEQAAKQGSAVAQFSLGVMNYPIGDLSFDTSKGNLSEALIWYRRAADQGDFDAMVAMGMATLTELACRRMM